MARSNITSVSKQLISDDGSVLASVIQGEQTRMDIVVGWLNNLLGCEIVCKVVEGDNVQDSGAIPVTANDTPVVTVLPIIDLDPQDNMFSIVIPETLIDNWDTYPSIDKPIYGFIGLEIKDVGVGIEQQIWKPMRGLVQVRYSPTEVT